MELFKAVAEASEEPIESCQALFSQGASCDFVDDEGTSAIHVASAKGFNKLLEQMIASFPAEVNRRKVNGRRPLDVALSNTNQDGWTLLVENGATDLISVYLNANQNGSDFLSFIAQKENFRQIAGAEMRLMSEQAKLTQIDGDKFIKFNTKHSDLEFRILELIYISLITTCFLAALGAQ